MVNTVKYFVYIICCAIVVLLLSGFIHKGDKAELKPANVFEWEKPVLVYFWNDTQGSNNDCDIVFGVTRNTPNAETLAPGALEQLLIGPSQSDIESGFSTAIPEGVLLQKFEVINGTAYADFSSELSKIAGSCRVRGVRAQIERTLTDLPDIDNVVVSVNGQTEGILEP